MKQEKGKSTRSIHSGIKRHENYNSITTPIVHNTPYTFIDSEDLNNYMFKRVWGGGLGDREEYARDGNVTVRVVEQRLAALEGGEAALLFASGMNAFTTLLISKLSSGDHIILTDDCYRHTLDFCTVHLKKYGVETTMIPLGDYEALEQAIEPEKTKLIVSESPTNPFLRIMDFERLVSIAKKHDVETIIDSTFGTPLNQQPLKYGIDYVFHSATKYLSGHHDLLAGVVISDKKRISALREMRVVLGGLVSSETAYLIERGLRTLAIRVDRHNENAMAIAEFLESHPKIDCVWYPGLESHPDFELANKQMDHFGGVVSFEVKGDEETTNKFVDSLEIPYIAVSLGGVESLIGSPGIMAFYDFEPEDREAIGLKDNLLRFAIGIEDKEDLIADLQQALEKI